MTTSKMLWNSVLSTANAKYGCADVKNFYLETPMERYEYMRIPVHLIPDEFIRAYGLQDKIYKGYLYLEIRRGMYGLPQAGILANQLLRKRLEPHGYYEAKHTPGLWKHTTRPVTFTLVVHDFGIKYVGTEHAQHLIETLKKYYTVKTDWTGSLYCGIQLDWDYNYPTRHLDISMPKYVSEKRHEFSHKTPTHPQHSPHPAPPVRYGKAAQETAPPDNATPLPPDKHKRVQKVIGSFLYYGRAVDTTILKALNSLAHQQSKPTTTTLANTVTRLLSHPS